MHVLSSNRQIHLIALAMIMGVIKMDFRKNAGIVLIILGMILTMDRTKDFRTDNLFFQTLQKRDRQLRNMGNRIHKGAASAYDVLYNGN